MKQIAMLLVTFLILFDLSGCVLAAPQPALHADRPAVEGNRLTFSVRYDGESENVTLLAALYCGGVLTGVKRNVQDGEFEIEAEKAYMLKFFAWEKDTMRPVCDAVTFDGLGQSEEIQPYFTADSKISDVSADSAFGAYGRLLFPVNTGYFSGTTLGDLRLTWYNYIDPDKTVEIVNTLKTRAVRGETVFYDIYTDAEKAADSAKRNTGLFFFRGDPGAKFAICNAGGGFAYVGAMHDSFPHALELSKRGYNAFALIYRPGWDTAMEDLARAIAFVFEHADELQIDTADYSLWGGSAGARMAADLGSYGTAAYGEKDYPRPGAVIMQYTGHSEVTGTEPPTYNCVGTSDSIASWRTMQSRIERIKANGTDAEIEVFDGLPHGFGLGTGTAAEGWFANAVAFWERNMTSAPGKITEFLNNTLAGADGTVHYTYYLPAGYDENKRYPMLVTLPGWSNLFYTIETTPLENNNYAKSHAEKWTEILGDLIVVSPSLTDWGEKSARQTIELTEYFIENFAVDKNKIYAAGFSAGGETLSWVISSRPDLFTAYLHCASHWNGGFDAAASAKLPVYVTMAQRDEYYGPETAKEAYDGLTAAYRRAGISETEIGRLLVLDIKDDSYFGSNTYSYHGAGSKAILDENIIRWLTSHTKF